MPYNEAKKKKTEKRNNARDNQTPKELIPTTKLKDAFTLNAHPQVGKGNTRRDGIRIDNKQAHHSGVPLDVYTSYTEGFTEEQIKATDKALARQGVISGNHTLNKVDLWGRYHQGRSQGPYKGQGAHQRTLALGIDGTKVKNNYEAMSPAQRFAELDGFVSNMGTNHKIAQQSDMDSRMLLGRNNTPDNEFGGNFTQRILNPRDPEKAAQMAANAKAQRKLYKPPVQRALSSASREILQIGKGLLGNVKKLLKSTSKQSINRMPVGTGQMDEDLMTRSEKLRILPIEPYSMPRHLL